MLDSTQAIVLHGIRPEYFKSKVKGVQTIYDKDMWKVTWFNCFEYRWEEDVFPTWGTAVMFAIEYTRMNLRTLFPECQPRK